MGTSTCPSKQGLVLDAGIQEDLRLRHLQVADATRASLGLPIIEYIVTDAPLKVEAWYDPENGRSTGRVGNSDSLLRAVDVLVKCSGVDAVAVVTRFPEENSEDFCSYREGKGVDLLAGVEAIISHMIVRKYRIPAAHAPAVIPPPLSKSLSPKSSAEEIGYTFLPCVLAGLSNAPQYLVRNQDEFGRSCILASDVDSVVLPKDACSGDGAIAFSQIKRNKPMIICVQENETVLDYHPEKVGIQAVKAQNYWEAIGIVAAHKAGIDPKSLLRDGIANIKQGSSLSRSTVPMPFLESVGERRVLDHDRTYLRIS